MYVCMCVCMYVWMDGWMDGWMDEKLQKVFITKNYLKTFFNKELGISRLSYQGCTWFRSKSCHGQVSSCCYDPT